MMFNYPPFGFSNFGMNPLYNLRRQGGFYYKRPPIADFRNATGSVNNANSNFNSTANLTKNTALDSNLNMNFSNNTVLDSNSVRHNDMNFDSIENDNCSSYDDKVFEVFGFKFHSDDLLIIALMFFLYKERC